MNTVIRIILWVLTGFFVLSSIVFMPSLGSVFGLLASIILFPIGKWQNLLKKYLNA